VEGKLLAGSGDLPHCYYSADLTVLHFTGLYFNLAFG